MSREFVEHIVDLLQGMGPVDARAMFGGYGIFLDDLMFGLIAHEVLYLKVDDENRPDFEELGLDAFVYQGKTGPVTISYREAPPDALEDAEQLGRWGARAYAAARRAKG